MGQSSISSHVPPFNCVASQKPTIDIPILSHSVDPPTSSQHSAQSQYVQSPRIHDMLCDFLIESHKMFEIIEKSTKSIHLQVLCKETMATKCRCVTQIAQSFPAGLPENLDHRGSRGIAQRISETPSLPRLEPDPVSSRRLATFWPPLPMITPASLEDMISLKVRVVWAYSSSVLGAGSPSGSRRGSLSSSLRWSRFSSMLPPLAGSGNFEDPSITIRPMQAYRDETRLIRFPVR
ncbi:hypothetical protein QR685DRAFT_142048 [Neurospora intermedia]|uniref:Uncharacterized protein n=1 Tax=Neurospora intermedia TaxID=5142 RepID=A0ABR3CXM9_NEUIN